MQGKVGQTLCWHRDHALPASLPQFSTEKVRKLAKLRVKESMTPVQRGTSKQTELQGENMR